MESVLAATAGIAKLFMRENELGKVKPGYFADLILVDGNPLDDIAVLQNHDKLNVIMINGRIHKASYTEFLRPQTIPIPVSSKALSNYIAYEDELQRPRIGHLDFDTLSVTALAMPSGAPAHNLYEVIELGVDLSPTGDTVPLSSVKVLPPIHGRDILCVGKNYSEHAKEFNKSGYDASDKVDQPLHPVIFTKRSTSIIAYGEDIYPHQDFTKTLDYEGEIGVIIGKPGFRIAESEAMNHVWGYTIINDITAREKQRDHKQFYIGKSADAFCPMGPVAVPAVSLPKKLRVQTRINGQQRQDGTTDDLIFSVANLVKTLSEGTTLQAGDVLATGTPAGVGFGLDPPTFLKPGDTVEISVTGLGTLRNKVADASEANQTTAKLSKISCIPTLNLEQTCGGAGLTHIGEKSFYVEEIGPVDAKPMVFIHGLGGTNEFFHPLLQLLNTKESHRSILYDLEGHGHSPTKADSTVTISSYATDLHALLSHKAIKSPGGVLVAHSMGCLIALRFAIQHPDLVSTLVLLGPPPSPLPDAAAAAQRQRAATVRNGGGLRASGVATAVATAGTSARTKSEQPVAFSAVRASLASQNPEGYAKGCTALAKTAEEEDIPLEKIECPVLILTGDEDKLSTPELVEKMKARIRRAKVAVLPDVGHWSVMEDVEAVTGAVRKFLWLDLEGRDVRT
ncbi:MAG: hypothetical protein Q9160_001083 [Pyrenula sp. 1 TL-2023]